jgi:NAD(P)-dependent dehydrogenase (short-subunit alcohol dehydrogenase family)
VIAANVAKAALDRFGQIDILVNNAAVIGPPQPIGEEDVDAWVETFRINVFGPYFMTRAVVPAMKKAKRGKIIDVNSAANRGTGGNLVPYRVSKAALIRLTNALADQLLPAGIEVNTFDAHATTPMVHEMAKWDDQDPALAARFRQRLKNGEPTPEQNAEYCLWLASSRGDGMHGRNVAWWMDLSDLDRLKAQIIADPRALRMDMVEVPGVKKTAWAEEYDKRRFAPPPPAKS